MNTIECQEDPCRKMVVKCEVLRRSGAQGVISEEDLFYNVVLLLIYNASEDAARKECWRECIEALGDELTRRLEQWFCSELESRDYQWDPTALVVDVRNAEMVEAKRRAIRPHLIALHAALRSQVNRGI